MLPRLPAESDALADAEAGWAALPGGGATARGLGALAARCVDAAGDRRPTTAEVRGGRGGGGAG